jgi:hypothetical protein
VTVFALALSLGLPLPAGAETRSRASSGFVVSPIYQNVSIGAEQPQAHYVVNLNNNTQLAQAFKLSTEDFGSLNNSAGVAFLGTSTSSFAKKYGLSSWMKLDQNTVTVPAGQSVNVGVTIENSDTLTAGGHYGAILATALTAPNGPAVQPRVGVFEVVSSLILLIKQGDVSLGLVAASQSSNGGWWAVASNVTDKFSNTGNVHVIPRGLVQVRDPLGHVVERGSINEDSGIILPENSRTYVTPMMKLVAAKWPGQYSVTLTYRIDGDAGQKTITSSYWYLGMMGTLAAVVVVLIVGGAGLVILRPRLRRRKRAKAQR